VSITLPQEVIDTMASREHRLHHWLWHEVRNNWLLYPDDVKQQIRDLGWEPPRPALDERRRPILDNDAGEDFLYMHRQMLVDVSRILARVKDPGYPRVLVWTVPPASDDPQFPVPAAWFDPSGNDAFDRRTSFESLQRVKSDGFYVKRILPWHRMFTDPAYLRGISLGKLASLIEATIHASMHVRWSSPPGGIRPDPGPAEGHTIDERWDDPRYDYLGDTYSSHVHPVFWSLHGWVDDRIEDWKLANGVYGADFWKGTWVGKMPTTEGTVQPPPVEAPATPQPEPVPQPEPTEPAPAPASPSGHPSMEPAPGKQPVKAEAHRLATRPLITGHEDPRAVPPGVDALIASPEHGHGHRDELEELVTVIGRCGIFHPGYATHLTREGYVIER
jgi:hypothetical protein